MLQAGPHRLDPRDAREWLRRALELMAARPLHFIAAAVLVTGGSAGLLALPIWGGLLPVSGPWMALLATTVCYGLPLGLGVALACGMARAADDRRPMPLRRFAEPDTLRLLFRAALFLFAMLLQGFITLYLLDELTRPVGSLSNIGPGQSPGGGGFFGVHDTLLGTQFSMCGGLLLVTQVVFAIFVTPLQLFRELTVAEAWRLSFRAMQLNPWLPPTLGLPGLMMILVASADAFKVVVQVAALPLPPLLGALIYVAWKDVFEVRRPASRGSEAIGTR